MNGGKITEGSLKDLMEGKVMTFETSEETEEYAEYNDNVYLTNDEMLKLLNMNDYDDANTEDTEGGRSDAIMPWGLSFEEIKSTMEDITGDGKIMKCIKRPGVGEVIPENALVKIHYAACLEAADEPFDSTYKRHAPSSYRLNEGNLIPGLEAGLQTMKKHEIAHFIVHPSLAYGLLGCPDIVPANSEVLFAVHLVDYMDNASADTYENLSAEEKNNFTAVKEAVNIELQTAKEKVENLKIKEAIRIYRRVVQMLEEVRLENNEEEVEMKKLLTKAYGNLAICHNKENQPRRACQACQRVPIQNVKTHFAYGKALHMLGDYKESMRSLQLARKLEPRNQDIINEIQLVNAKQVKFQDVERRMCRRVFGNSEKVNSEFIDVAKEFCVTFANDKKVLRQPLPDGLMQQEEQYIREQAAILGLSVIEHKRFETTRVYLSKPDFM